MEERVSQMIAKDGIDVPFANFITSIDMLKLFESEGYILLAIRSTYKKTLLSIYCWKSRKCRGYACGTGFLVRD